MPQATRPAAPPTVPDVFWLFARVGLTSLGGGIGAWLFHELVERKGWMKEDEYFDSLALCQALPGVNASNIAVWSGKRLLGLKGAIAAFAGVIIVPSFLIVAVSFVVGLVSRYPITQTALAGATAAAVALPFSLSLHMVRRVRRDIVPLTVLLATFATVAIFKWPLVYVVPVAAIVSVAFEYRRLRRGAA